MNKPLALKRRDVPLQHWRFTPLFDENIIAEMTAEGDTMAFSEAVMVLARKDGSILVYRTDNNNSEDLAISILEKGIEFLRQPWENK